MQILLDWFHFRRLRRGILTIFYLLPYLLLSFVYGKNNIVFAECWVKFKFGKIKHNNWGDDLNYYLFKNYSKKKVLFLPYSRLFIKNDVEVFSLIGSILNAYCLDKKVIYGSGILLPNKKILGVPKKIISVRGPKTREILIKNGVNCPESYGDPALLLPLFYKPTHAKKKRGLLIPHLNTKHAFNTKSINELSIKLKADILDMTSYDKWTDIIDKIVMSNFVISESLHGLIVAETYGIPNVWVEFIKHPTDWNFKYYDFFESIGKKEYALKCWGDSINLELINQKLLKWKKAKIDYKKMLSYFPFEIKGDINKENLIDMVD